MQVNAKDFLELIEYVVKLYQCVYKYNTNFNSFQYSLTVTDRGLTLNISFPTLVESVSASVGNDNMDEFRAKIDEIIKYYTNKINGLILQ